VARNAEAADAALAYCEAAVAVLAELDDPRQESFQSGWTRQGDLFVRHARTELRINDVRDELRGLPEFAAAVEAISADAQMGKQFGWVGTGLESGPLSAGDILDGILRAGISDDDPIRVDEGAARQAYEERERALYADTVRYIFVAPLLWLEAEDLPIELDERVELDALRDGEIERCLSMGLLPFARVDFPFVPIGRLVGLRVTYVVPKALPKRKKRFPDSTEQARAILKETPALLERMTQVLALLKAGVVGSPGYIYFADDPLHRGTSGWDPLGGGAPRGGIYPLASSENAQVRELWAMLSADEVVKHKTLPAALRRFMHAADRYPPEDKLIDLMIAAETLFLLPGEEQEDSTYRLALRSASFLADRGRPRAQTFARMKQAYRASRWFIHRGQFGKLDLGDRRPVELGEFVEETSELVREALAKAVRVAGDPGADSLFDFGSPIPGE
jgi:hypothetical protein